MVRRTVQTAVALGVLYLAWKVGMAAATTALSVATVGTLGIAVGGAFAAGGMIGNLAKGKSLYDSIDSALTTYSAVNAIISACAVASFNLST